MTVFLNQMYLLKEHIFIVIACFSFKQINLIVKMKWKVKTHLEEGQIVSQTEVYHLDLQIAPVS